MHTVFPSFLIERGALTKGEKRMKRFFTSESVTEGHPDKMCDIIADSILDEILKCDPEARVACEVTACTGLVSVMGEISCDCYADIQKIVRDTVREIGYTRAKYGFDGNTCAVISSIHEQSKDIAMGVDKAYDFKGEIADQIGAGDQGMMFGYACRETEEYMPLAITLAHKMNRKLAEVRKSGEIPYLRPDGKGQVTVEYDGDKITRVDTVVLSAQHSEEVDIDEVRRDLKQKVIGKVIPEKLMDKDTKIFINPTGRFTIGGPMGDTGLTGRKIIVDTYGGYAPHGGGSFSGKDPTKVDRSAAYMARYACKNVVASGLADRCEIEVAYAIGIAKPVSLFVNTFGTGKLSDEKLSEIVLKEFDFRPYSIIRHLDLRKPVYKETASYGHFGRNGFSWEKTDRINDLKKYLK